MQGSSFIVPGFFQGAEIEPGTMHSLRSLREHRAGNHAATNGSTITQMESACPGYLPVPIVLPPTEANRTRD